MKRIAIVIIVLIGITLITGIASAFQGKPGTVMPLTLKNFKLTTDTPILPDWKPSRIRWQLIDPSGDVNYFVDDQLDSVTSPGGLPIFGATTWTINENTGTMKMPAFATPGEWKMNALFYDKQFIFLNKVGVDTYTIQVSEGSMSDNLMAPLTTTFSIPLLGDYAIGVDLIYLIAIVIILPMLLLSFIALKPGRRKPHVG